MTTPRKRGRPRKSAGAGRGKPIKGSFCRLKPDSPNVVIVASGFYPNGKREFRREDEPFEVTDLEFRLVLSRGRQLFKFYHNAKKVR